MIAKTVLDELWKITIERFNEVIDGLEKGEIRVAEKKDGQWVVNKWVKEVILAGFKLGQVTDMSQGQFPFFDKDTFPVRQFSAEDGVRIVPGGTSIRRGAYVAPGAIVMPPAYINVGAFVDSGTMVDSHVTIGSCAQVGKNIHISASTQIGGVLEPAGALPTIIEDGAFVGGNCGIYEGTIVQEGAVIASGVIITSSTALFDATTGEFIRRNADGRVVVPRGAVVVSGSKPIIRGPASPSRAACTSIAPSSSNTATRRPPAASSSKTCFDNFANFLLTTGGILRPRNAAG